MDRPVKNNILWICLAALLAGALIFPEIWQGSVSFFCWDDYLVDYQSTFALTGFFYQGGLQLWDFFGQLPHVYFWMTHGMFRVPDVLTAIAYVLFSPFVDNSAQFFNQVFAIVYVGSLLCIRTIGIFLLLKRLTDDKWVLRAGTVIFALLYCPPAFVFGTFYQSYFPLMMYFVLSFFLTWRVLYLGMAMLFMLLSFSQGILHTCYMYLGINFFIVSCAVYSLFTRFAKLQRWKEYFSKNSRVLRLWGLGLLATAMVILGPYIYMQLFWLKDVAFGADHSRLAGMWSISHYFHSLNLDHSPPGDFFRRMLDFTFLTGLSFFYGYMMFFLIGLAVTMSPDRRKWIFVMAILLAWFINFPKETFSIGLIGHWVNVLTNPLKVMVRSYQTAINSFIGYAFMPLAVMGLGVLKDLGKKPVNFKRLGVFAVFMAAFAVYGSFNQPSIIRIYFITVMTFSLIALALLIWVGRGRLMRRAANAIFVILILVDMSLCVWEMKHWILPTYRLSPHFVESLPAQTGIVGLDFHNPKIFPYAGETDLYPMISQPCLWSLRDISLNYVADINRESLFIPLNNYNPRHVSFLGWQDDPVRREYVSQNNKLFFFTRYAVQKGSGVFEDIVRRGLSRDVLMVDGQEPSVRTGVPSSIVPLPVGQDQWASISKDTTDNWNTWVYRDGMAIWDFPVPAGIPNFYATNIFTQDHWVRFFIQSADQKYTELTPVQGQLLRPMTFDVQNIKERKVFVALPVDQSLFGMKGVLLLKVRDASGVTSLWLHRSDDTGITFQAPTDGWLGIQYPYDPKWRIDVDGKPAHFYRADKSFIGLPLTQGEHKILIRYWPHSWLRWGLPLSVALTCVLFISLIIFALWDASYIKDDISSAHE